jgi:YNFM family putative membrane transporter
VLRALQGAAIAGIPASGIAYIGDEVHPKAVITAIGLFVAGNSIGGLSGRILTGWVTQLLGWRAALLSVALVSLLCALVFRALLPRARHFSAEPLSPPAVFRTLRLHLSSGLLGRLFAIGRLYLTVFGAVYTVIGYRLTAEPFHLSQGLVGSVFVIYLVGTVSSSAAGRLTLRLGRRGTQYASALTAALGLLLTLSSSLYVVLLGLVLVTAGFFAGHAVASGSVSRASTAGRAQAAALYQVAYYAGSSLGATLGAVAFHAYGWDAVVALGLAAVLGIAGITAYSSLAGSHVSVSGRAFSAESRLRHDVLNRRTG